MSAHKRKHWSVTLYDDGQQFGPFRISMGFPITAVEAAMYAMREAKRPKGFTLNVKFASKPVNARMRK